MPKVGRPVSAERGDALERLSEHVLVEEEIGVEAWIMTEAQNILVMPWTRQ